MKFDKSTIGSLIGLFAWSILMGVTAISMGGGALFPPINYIAKPLACPTGQFSYNQNVSNPYPGTTYTTAVWTCTDSKSGSETSIDAIKMGVYTGPFYGLLLFLVVFPFWYQYTLSNQRKKAAELEWQRKWNAEFGHKSRRT